MSETMSADERVKRFVEDGFDLADDSGESWHALVGLVEQAEQAAAEKAREDAIEELRRWATGMIEVCLNNENDSIAEDDDKRANVWMSKRGAYQHTVYECGALKERKP